LKAIKYIKIAVAVLFVLYFILLIPEPANSPVAPAQKEPFLWKRDSLWHSLEKSFIKARQTDPNLLSFEIDKTLFEINNQLNTINLQVREPSSYLFTQLERDFFTAAPMVAAYPAKFTAYVDLYTKMRMAVKDQSIHWDVNNPETRKTIYRLLYGGRAAVEEIMLQLAPKDLPEKINGYDEPSKTPEADILGVKIHSGDILVSRGGAPTSALIARGNDYPGNFSHIALVYVDPKTHLASIVEAHIERGVVVSSLEEYLKDTKLRVMILRLRADLPAIQKDPFIPHKTALTALEEVKDGHIPYDFEMDYSNHTKKFCSEVVSAPYDRLGITFWKGISHISAPGIVNWLSTFGVKNFETQEPSDLEYDPQLRVVAEWRDPDTLYKDHIDNAVIEAMLDRANEGKELDYSLYLLPFARIAKLYSAVLNLFDGTGPVPEGMSAATALRNKQFSSDHESIKRIVEAKGEEFRKNNNYTPPFWQLYGFAKEAVKELKY